jgi:dTDP-L-rhamnose 4-epimerase
MVGRFREGDIRACYADVAKARELLGFEAKVPIETGAKQLAAWVASQQSLDRTGEALADLERHDLVR